MSSKPAIVFRADGDSQIGLGHIVRSTALANMIRDSYATILATRCTIESVVNEARAVFSTVLSLSEQKAEEELADLSSQLNPIHLMVLDGYQFDDAYQKELVKNRLPFFAIDDIHSFPFFSRVVINHAGGISSTDYKARPSTQFYLGPQYALLRPAFLDAAKARRNARTDNNCFVCYGGADPDNRTLRTIKEQLSSQRCFENFHVVVGSAYRFRPELEDFAAGRKDISIYSSLSPEQMVAVMKKCSYAICSPSTIVYEYLSVGGIVFLDLIADNQKDVIRYFVNEGMAFPLERAGNLSDKDIRTAFEKQAIVFDGNSGLRYQKLFRQYFESEKLSLRKAVDGDLLCSYEWANDPLVRKQSFSQSPISLEEHSRWFSARLQDSNCYYYIFEIDNMPVAQIRFQVNNGEAVLGYLVADSIRSKGLGTFILSKGIEQLLKDLKKPVCVAGHVKKDNIASQRSFEKLAFKKEESTVFPDSFTYTMMVDGNFD